MDSLVVIKKFGYKSALFENLELSFDNSSKIGIVGNNGVGKTTLLKLISQQITASGVSVVVNPDIGYFDINYTLNKEYSFHDNCKLYSRYLQKDLIEEYVQKFAFNKHKNLKINKLSKGNLVKAHLIFLLSLEKSFYFWDEPFSNLDEKSKTVFKLILQEASFGFLLISHDFQMITSCCNKIYEIKNKTLIPVNNF